MARWRGRAGQASVCAAVTAVACALLGAGCLHQTTDPSERAFHAVSIDDLYIDGLGRPSATGRIRSALLDAVALHDSRGALIGFTSYRGFISSGSLHAVRTAS